MPHEFATSRVAVRSSQPEETANSGMMAPGLSRRVSGSAQAEVGRRRWPATPIAGRRGAVGAEGDTQNGGTVAGQPLDERLAPRTKSERSRVIGYERSRTVARRSSGHSLSRKRQSFGAPRPVGSAEPVSQLKTVDSDTPISRASSAAVIPVVA